jgi:hypothetical protein
MLCLAKVLGRQSEEYICVGLTKSFASFEHKPLYRKESLDSSPKPKCIRKAELAVMEIVASLREPQAALMELMTPG